MTQSAPRDPFLLWLDGNESTIPLGRYAFSRPTQIRMLREAWEAGRRHQMKRNKLELADLLRAVVTMVDADLVGPTARRKMGGGSSRRLQAAGACVALTALKAKLLAHLILTSDAQTSPGVAPDEAAPACGSEGGPPVYETLEAQEGDRDVEILARMGAHVRGEHTVPVGGCQDCVTEAIRLGYAVMGLTPPEPESPARPDGLDGID